MDFVVQLLKETGILIVNGLVFHPVDGKGYARIVFLPPIEEVDDPYNALEAFMRKTKAINHSIMLTLAFLTHHSTIKIDLLFQFR